MATTKSKSKKIEATYTRDPVPSDRVGTCPCCLRQPRASGRAGALQRHGWKEAGRQVGQYGRGFQWGACIGSGMAPLEETDRDALVVLARLAAHIEETSAALDLHQAGADSYLHEARVEVRWRRETEAEKAEVQAALRGLDASIKVASETSRGGRRYDVVVATVTVPRGAPAQDRDRDGLRIRVPAYADLQARTVAAVERTLAALVAQEAAIKAAVAHHRANPSQGAADPVRRGPALHLARTLKGHAGPVVRAACAAFGFRARYMATTEDRAKVTCTRCLKH